MNHPDGRERQRREGRGGEERRQSSKAEFLPGICLGLYGKGHPVFKTPALKGVLEAHFS